MKTSKAVLRIIAVVIAIFFCLSGGMAVADNDQENIVVIVDNQNLSFETPPVNNQGTVMVPMRAVFEALHASVTWSEKDQKVTAEKEGVLVQLIPGSPFAHINDRAVVLSSSPYVSNGNTMVPLRFVSEAFGASVSWNPIDQSVTINSMSSNAASGQNTADTLPQNNTAASATFVPSTLTVQFVPSQNAETLEAKAKPLEKLLGERLGIPVKMTVSNDYNNVIKAMAAKKVDISFLPPTQYIYAHDYYKVADVLMQALRYGVDPRTGKPTQQLVDFYQSMFVVRADSPIRIIEDLRGKTIGWQGVTSAAGYVYPGLILKKNGIDPVNDVKGVMFQGHDKSIVSLLNGQVEAAAVFQDVRSIMLKDFPNVLSDTRILAFSDKIPNDTIAVRSDMDPEWRKKIQDAFISLRNDPVGKKTIQDVFAHQGYTPSEEKKFEIVREVIRSMNEK